MLQEKMHGSLMENLLTLLAYDDTHGRIVIGTVTPDMFEGDLKIIADKIFQYWRQQNEAPKNHTSDLLSYIIEDPRNRKAATFKNILGAMHEMAKGINAKYVCDQATMFVRQQKIKGAILRSAEIISGPEPTAVEDVENILQDILKARDFAFDPGLRLSDWEKVIDYLNQHYEEFDTGIPEFDQHFVVPNRGALLILLGEYGSGKTWGAVHLGKRALMRRKKVLHVTTEVSGEEVMLRYYMSLFAVPRHEREDGMVQIPAVETDENDIVGFKTRSVRPDFAFDWPSIKTELRNNIDRRFGDKFNIRVLRVAPHSMTTNGLRAYMDTLEQSEGFIPDMLIVDSGYLLKQETKGKDDFRIGLGRTIVELRAIAVDRNMAVINTHQLQRIERRATARATNRAGAGNAAEDISIAWTADIVLVQDSTETERALGLSRLYADKVRHERGGQAVLMTQSYETGQYVLTTYPLNQSYFETINNERATADDDEAESDGD